VSERGRNGDREFVRDVLARTSGSACDRACGLLPDLTDGQLEMLDRQLVRQHLEHCPACRAVAVALGWLGTELAGLASLEPGPDFTQTVLARTSGRTATARARRAAAVAATGPGGLMDRFGRWWQDRILRPGFALQTAYAVTVILVLLTATPISPLRGAPGRALDVMRAGPDALPLVGSASEWIAVRTDSTTASLRRGVDTGLEIAGNSLTARAERSAPARARFSRHIAAVVGHLAGGRPGDAGRELLDALNAGSEAWDHWWTTRPENADVNG
jgi:hypothetical protein